MQSEPHLPRVSGLKHIPCPIILAASLGMGVEKVLMHPLIYALLLAGCRELVNPWCSLVAFTTYLKQKVQVPPEGEKTWRAQGERFRVPYQNTGCLASSLVFPVTIALLAEDGHLVKLEEKTAQAPSMACSLVQDQGTYVLVQIISKWGPRLFLCSYVG